MIYRVTLPNGETLHTGHGPLADVWLNRHGGKLVSHYIAVDQSGLICGLWPTHEAAIADANQQSGYPDGIMTTADGEVTLRWTTYEASPALAATVEAHGGDLPWTWTRVGGARRACLPRERQ